MTLFDLIPPIPEWWKKEPYAIVNEEGLVKKPRKVKEKVLSDRQLYRRECDLKYNQKRRENRAALKALNASS